jgi:hypothetical protein
MKGGYFMPVFDFEEFVDQRLNSYHESNVKTEQCKQKQGEVFRWSEAMCHALNPAQRALYFELDSAEGELMCLSDESLYKAALAEGIALGTAYANSKKTEGNKWTATNTCQA